MKGMQHDNFVEASNTALWLNSQLKDAKSQLVDLRHQNQNLHIELRGLNDKRVMEQKELAIAQDKLAESIGLSRRLQTNLD